MIPPYLQHRERNTVQCNRTRYCIGCKCSILFMVVLCSIGYRNIFFGFYTQNLRKKKSINVGIKDFDFWYLKHIDFSLIACRKISSSFLIYLAIALAWLSTRSLKSVFVKCFTPPLSSEHDLQLYAIKSKFDLPIWGLHMKRK